MDPVVEKIAVALLPDVVKDGGRRTIVFPVFSYRVCSGRETKRQVRDSANDIALGR